jgi:hypothetical protein
VPAVQRLLSRHGLEDEDVADAFAEAAPLLAGWAEASVQRWAMAGAERQRPTCLGDARPPSASAPPIVHARLEGFDLHAGVRIAAGLSACVATRSGRRWRATTCTARASAT